MHIGIDYTAAIRQGGGIGRYTRELITALLDLPTNNHQYTLFAATGGLRIRNCESLSTVRNSQFTIRNSPAKIRCRTIPISDEWLARIWHRARLPIPVELITGLIDVFYSPDFVLPPTLPRAKTLLTVHDLSFLHYPDHFVPKLVSYLSRVVPRSINRADWVLADSKATRDDLVQMLGVEREKIDVLYCGVADRFQPEPEPGEREQIREHYDLDPRPYVLAVGTVQPRKNHLGLIRAFAQLGRTDVQLVIAGGRGWLYEDVLTEAEQHADRVRMLGFVADEDLPALYRGASLLAFPSFYEGFGLPVLEAMACGTPVVCSNASSVPEVAGDAALMVDPHDGTALTDALRRVLDDEALREEMIAKGIAQTARFTWKRAADQLLATFQRL